MRRVVALGRIRTSITQLIQKPFGRTLLGGLALPFEVRKQLLQKRRSPGLFTWHIDIHHGRGIPSRDHNLTCLTLGC